MNRRTPPKLLPVRRIVGPMLGVFIAASLVFAVVRDRESQLRYRGQPLTDIILSLSNNEFWKTSCCPFALTPTTPDAFFVREALVQTGTNAAGLIRSWLIKQEPNWRNSVSERIWRIVGGSYPSVDDRRIVASRCAMLDREIASLCVPELFSCLESNDQLLQCNAIMALTAVAAGDKLFSARYRRELDLVHIDFGGGDAHVTTPRFVFNRYLFSITDASSSADNAGVLFK